MWFSRMKLPMSAPLSNAAFWLMFFFSIIIGLYAFVALIGLQFTTPDLSLKFEHWRIAISLHAVGGGIALLIGGFQFWPWVRLNHPSIHRKMGRIYLLCIFFSGMAGLLLAPTSDGGVSAHFGFGLLAICWLFSGLQAYLSILRRDIDAHKVWMIRNFSLTFGAVTLRLYMGLFSAFDVDPSEAFQAVAWLAWVPNLIVVEWYLNSKLNASHFIVFERG